MRSMSHSGALVLAAILAGLTSSGCDRQDAAGAESATLDISLASPEETVRTVLKGLRAIQTAVADGSGAKAERLRETLGQAVDVERVSKALAKIPPIQHNMVGEDVRAGTVRNWASTTAYYAGGAQLDQMFRTKQTPTTVVIVAPASGKNDDALIQLTCNVGEDGLWRVSRLEFVVDAQPLAAASQPDS